MLSDARVHATLPAQDIERAKSFYADKLGLKPVEETPGGLWYDMGDGTRFLLFPSGGAASGTHTQVGFLVTDIVSEVEDMKGDGVEFIEYDTEYLKTFNGIAEFPGGKSAWFKDSEGNMLGMVQLG